MFPTRIKRVVKDIKTKIINANFEDEVTYFIHDTIDYLISFYESHLYIEDADSEIDIIYDDIIEQLNELVDWCHANYSKYRFCDFLSSEIGRLKSETIGYSDDDESSSESSEESGFSDFSE